MTDPQPSPAYKDDDLVYVDPDLRTVVGIVEFDQKDVPKPKVWPRVVDEKEPTEGTHSTGSGQADGKEGKDGRRRGPRRERFYPWGTYKSMKKIYRLEGKEKWQPSEKTLDEVIEKALEQPFWD